MRRPRNLYWRFQSSVLFSLALLFAPKTSAAYVFAGIGDVWASAIVEAQINKLPHSKEYNQAGVKSWKESALRATQLLTAHSYKEALDEAKQANRIYATCDANLVQLWQCNNLLQGIVRTRTGQFREAKPFLDGIVDIRHIKDPSKLARMDTVVLSSVLLEIGRCHQFLANYERANLLYGRTLSLLWERPDSDAIRVLRAHVYLHLAALKYERGNYNEVWDYTDRSFDAIGKLTSTAEVQIATLQGQWFLDAEGFEEANTTFALTLERVESINEKFAPSPTELAYLKAHVEIANACKKNAVDLNELRKEADEIATTASPYEDLMQAEVLLRKCQITLNSGDTSTGSLFAERATQICERVFGNDHPRTARCRYWTACVLRCDGKLEQAKAMLEECLTVQKKHLGNDHLHVAHTRMLLAEFATIQKTFQETEEHLRLAAQAYEFTFGAEHFRTVKLRLELGKFLMGLGNRNEAKNIFEQIRRERKARGFEASSQYIEASANLAIVYYVNDDLVNAERVLRTISQSHEDVSSFDNNVRAVCLGLWSAIYRKQSKLDRAEEAARSLVQLQITLNRAFTLSSAKDHWTLAEILQSQGKLDESEAYFRYSLMLLERHWGETSPRLRPYLAFLKEFYSSRQDSASVSEIETHLSRLSTSSDEPETLEVEILGSLGSGPRRQ